MGEEEDGVRGRGSERERNIDLVSHVCTCVRIYVNVCMCVYTFVCVCRLGLKLTAGDIWHQELLSGLPGCVIFSQFGASLVVMYKEIIQFSGFGEA